MLPWVSLIGTTKYLSGNEPFRFLEEEHYRQREQQRGPKTEPSLMCGGNSKEAFVATVE